jgi:hypothetical protein
MLGVYGIDPFVLVNVHHHGIQEIRNLRLFNLVDKPLGVLRAGKLLTKPVKPKATMDALLEYSPQMRIPLEYDDVPYTVLMAR